MSEIKEGVQNAVQDEIPKRFIDGCEGDMKEARRRWDITRKWRETERVNQVLSEPQPNFDLIKKMYPHHHCGRGKDGHVVYYERPGEFEIAKLIAQGVSIEDMVRHWLFVTEYQWEVLSEGDQTAKGITVMDMNGMKLSNLAGDNMTFLKRSIGYANQHWSHAILAINAPYYISMLWKLVKPLVHENTQKKVRIFTAKETLAGLQEFIDISQIPVFYGGEKDFGGKDSCRFQAPEVLAMEEFVVNLNGGKRSGVTSLDDSPVTTDCGMAKNESQSSLLPEEGEQSPQPDSKSMLQLEVNQSNVLSAELVENEESTLETIEE